MPDNEIGEDTSSSSLHLWLKIKVLRRPIETAVDKARASAA